MIIATPRVSPTVVCHQTACGRRLTPSPFVIPFVELIRRIIPDNSLLQQQNQDILVQLLVITKQLLLLC